MPGYNGKPRRSFSLVLTEHADQSERNNPNNLIPIKS